MNKTAEILQDSADYYLHQIQKNDALIAPYVQKMYARADSLTYEEAYMLREHLLDQRALIHLLAEVNRQLAEFKKGSSLLRLFARRK